MYVVCRVSQTGPTTCYKIIKVVTPTDVQVF